MKCNEINEHILLCHSSNVYAGFTKLLFKTTELIIEAKINSY